MMCNPQSVSMCCPHWHPQQINWSEKSCWPTGRVSCCTALTNTNECQGHAGSMWLWSHCGQNGTFAVQNGCGLTQGACIEQSLQCGSTGHWCVAQCKHARCSAVQAHDCFVLFCCNEFHQCKLSNLNTARCVVLLCCRSVMTHLHSGKCSESVWKVLPNGSHALCLHVTCWHNTFEACKAWQHFPNTFRWTVGHKCKLRSLPPDPNAGHVCICR